MSNKIINLNINGMTCSGCSSHIEKDLNVKDGIVSSIVNHETGKGEFVYDSNKLSNQDVINAVNNVGNYLVIEDIEKEDCCVTNAKDYDGKNKFDLIVIGGGSAAFSAAILGGLLAFLWFNVHPARFFMGDTGAMSLGTTLGIIAMLTNSALVLPIIAFPLVLESGSVILQVTSKKLRRGRKIFRSAPIHHHFEAKGWAPEKVTMRFWIISIMFALIGMILALIG